MAKGDALRFLSQQKDLYQVMPLKLCRLAVSARIRGWQPFSVKGRRVNVFSLRAALQWSLSHLFNSAVQDTSMNGRGRVPISRYLRTLKYNFHMVQNITLSLIKKFYLEIV